MHSSKKTSSSLLLGIGLVLTGCPKSPVEDASSTKSAEGSPSNDDGIDSTDSEIPNNAPFPFVTKIPQTPVEELTERQQKQIAARVNHETRLRSEMVGVSFFGVEEKALSIEAFGKIYTLEKTGEDTTDSEFFIQEGQVKECDDSEVRVRFNEADRWANFGFHCDGLNYILDSLSDGLYLLQETDLRHWFPKDDQTRYTPRDAEEQANNPAPHTARMSTVIAPTPIERDFVVESGAEANFRANSIRLKTGFKAKAGSKVRVSRTP